MNFIITSNAIATNYSYKYYVRAADNKRDERKKWKFIIN